MSAWPPEQWIFLLAALTLLCALTTVVGMVLNALKHAATQQVLQANTATTEHTLIQLQNTNQAVRRAEASITDQTQQLEALVTHLQTQNETLALKVAQAQAMLQAIDDLRVVLGTEERQHLFDHELAALKALLLDQPLPAREAHP